MYIKKEIHTYIYIHIYIYMYTYTYKMVEHVPCAPYVEVGSRPCTRSLSAAAY